MVTRSRTTAMCVNIHWKVSCGEKKPTRLKWHSVTHKTECEVIVYIWYSNTVQVSFLCTCADRLFLFRLFSFLLRRTPVSLERPKPLLTLDSLDWVAGATASPRLMHFFSYTRKINHHKSRTFVRTHLFTAKARKIQNKSYCNCIWRKKKMGIWMVYKNLVLGISVSSQCN